MITRLVIGVAPSCDFNLDGTLTLCGPAYIRARILDLQETTEDVTIETYSPIVVDAVVQVWILTGAEDWLGMIWVGRHQLVGLHAREWLAHFSVADLLTRGEFDKFLDE